MACPGSVALGAKVPPTTSDYAREGTAAHSLGERCLREGLDAAALIDKEIEAEGGAPFTVDDEMAEAVQVYLDFVRAEVADGDAVFFEHPFHLKEFHEGFWGTNDVCVYKPRERRLIVADYKHGKGVPVEVERNKQLMYYALGAATAVRDRPLVEVEIAIIQPRCPHPDGPVRRWTTTPMDLIEFGAELVAAAAETEKPDAPLAAGDHCRFCNAAPICPELRRRTLELAHVEFGVNSGEPILREPDVMSPDEIAAVLTEAGMVKDWFRRVEEFANAQALQGNLPTGFKLVRGRAGKRTFKDEDAACAFLVECGVEQEHIYVEPKLRSPAQIEAVLKKSYGYKGKKAGELIADLVGQKPGGLNLVPESDPRPPAVVDPDADFSEMLT